MAETPSFPARNLLDAETSPYLLQHRHNPVHWRAWGEEAFAEAKATGKPILLSVGYAACHWCHVMAHESFENQAIADLMNEMFVNVKVDREERPDVDAIYQHALALMDQHGGWPLTMFLTPDGKPFWGGTYFPPAAKYGRPGFGDVLRSLHDTWMRRPEDIKRNVDALLENLTHQARSPGSAPLSLAFLTHAAQQAARLFDPVQGGLRGAPKFPQASLLRFMWNMACRHNAKEAASAVSLTLERMALGGIYDHVGGGFMRYSTDESWLVPHFEKMLYDNAQLVELYARAWKSDRKPLHARCVEQTVGWLLREMMAEGNCFAATLDADSDGGEGRFYTWTKEAIEAVLPPDQAALVCRCFAVTSHGNWEHVNILHRNHPGGVLEQEDEKRLAEACRTLLTHRATRPPPGRDDKVLADWNGMMIAALAEASFIFARPDWLEAARAAYDGIKSLLGDGDRLHHCIRAGRRQPGILDDYAQMARAALTLAQVTAEAVFLEDAKRWTTAAARQFWDQDGKGYFLSAAEATDLIVRTKPMHDYATPNGNGVMAEVLATLWLMTGQDKHRERAEAVINAFSAALPQQFPHMPTFLDGFALLAEPIQIAVAGTDDQSMIRIIAETAPPQSVLIRSVDQTHLAKSHPAYGKAAVRGKATVYICREQSCSAPLTDADALRAALGGNQDQDHATVRL